MSDRAESSWHLDKRVPIALAVTIMLQTAGIVWWAATLTARQERLNEKVVEQQEQINRFVNERDDNRDRLTRLETQLSEIKMTLARVADAVGAKETRR